MGGLGDTVAARPREQAAASARAVTGTGVLRQGELQPQLLCSELSVPDQGSHPGALLGNEFLRSFAAVRHEFNLQHSRRQELCEHPPMEQPGSGSRAHCPRDGECLARVGARGPGTPPAGLLSPREANAARLAPCLWARGHWLVLSGKKGLLSQKHY